jgi:hypothetical protein
MMTIAARAATDHQVRLATLFKAVLPMGCIANLSPGSVHREPISKHRSRGHAGLQGAGRPEAVERQAFGFRTPRRREKMQGDLQDLS